MESDVGGDRFLVLSDALRAFVQATTDYEHLLDVIARTLGEVVKDGCVVRLLSEGGWLTPVGIHLPFERYVRDPSASARVRAHVARPHNVSEQQSAKRVIETGEPLLVSHLQVEQLRVGTTDEVVDAYQTVGIHSLLLVAIRVRGESIGLLALVRFAPTSPPFGERDRELAQTLADHAGLAISNARLLKAALKELADRKRAEVAFRRTEEQLRHAQKMEAIGRLAGGVAHDFNNVLTVILSYADMVGDALEADEPLLADIEQIKAAARRATELTKQLLALARRPGPEARSADLNEIVRRIERLVRRLLGAHIELTTLLGDGVSWVRGDPGHIEQVLMNLVINARDAMPAGGKLTIETINVQVDDESPRSTCC